MVEPPGGSTPYELSFSGRVLDGLSELIARANAQGRGQALLAAVRIMDRRLRVYPQFGQPLRDAAVESAQEWVGVIDPLVVHYVVDEDRRMVWVVRPIQLLPKSGY